MVPIKENIANKGNYGGSRSLSDIRYIVIHYTGNDGDTDENNGVYFKNNDVDASAHYFVDDDSITRSVPDNYVAWHCGGKTFKHKTCRNSNSIGIEICDDVRNGIIYPSAKTIENVLELTRSLMQKYKIPVENVIRHFDVTGKRCPAYWVDDKKWKSEFWNKIEGEDDMVYYKTIKDVPNAYKASIQKLITAGVLNGNGKGELNISEDFCRIMTVLDRKGLL